MILADKIIENRKKNGWSQEELANRLGVSRQSVSKWESAQAVPDLKKILQLAEAFGVTTDYLIKDEIEEKPELELAPVDKGLEETVRSVSMEEASSFLEYNESSSRLISTGVMVCILSPVVLILLAGLAEQGRIAMDVSVAEAAGTALLLIMVAAAVGVFIREGMRGKKYEYLERENCDRYRLWRGRNGEGAPGRLCGNPQQAADHRSYAVYCFGSTHARSLCSQVYQ